MPSAVLVIGALALLAVLFGAVGVALLAGAGWTFVYLATCCLAAAIVLARGLASG